MAVAQVIGGSAAGRRAPCSLQWVTCAAPAVARRPRRTSEPSSATSARHRPRTTLPRGRKTPSARPRCRYRWRRSGSSKCRTSQSSSTVAAARLTQARPRGRVRRDELVDGEQLCAPCGAAPVAVARTGSSAAPSAAPWPARRSATRRRRARLVGLRVDLHRRRVAVVHHVGLLHAAAALHRGQRLCRPSCSPMSPLQRRCWLTKVSERGVQRAAEGAEHRPVVHRLRRGDARRSGRPSAAAAMKPPLITRPASRRRTPASRAPGRPTCRPRCCPPRG